MNKKKPVDIALLVLAAGEASRMGRPKQLLSWNGATLLENAIIITQSLTQNYGVVLGAHYNQIAPLVSQSHIIYNANWRNGIGSSIACGVNALEQQYNPKAILIKLIDQPLLKKEHFENLINTHKTHPSQAICTAYASKNGVPAIFPKSYFAELKQLTHDFGARKLLANSKHKPIALDPNGKLIDLDTPADYDRLLRSSLE